MASADGSCWCDFHCATLGNCCSDFQSLCVSDEETSKGAQCSEIGDPNCASNEYCEFPSANECGQDGSLGTCKPRPEECEPGNGPVCGCDGHTYWSACRAQQARVSIVHEGECQQGHRCSRFEDDECGQDEYCELEAVTFGYGWADERGECRVKSGICSFLLYPVCGCDGRQYTSPCSAKNDGVMVAYAGTCGEDGALKGEQCGGIRGLECAPGLYCKPDASLGCGVMDAHGTCIELEACGDEESPVCGCDGKTYKNECSADHAGVTIESHVPCGESEAPLNKRCDGQFVAGECGPNHYCDYDSSDFCGLELQKAVCKPRPGQCPNTVEPVCGCDNRTYQNLCEAQKAGVDVLWLNACKS